MYHLAKMHSVTDRWMDRQTDRRHHASSQYYCTQYNWIKIISSALLMQHLVALTKWKR